MRTLDHAIDVLVDGLLDVDVGGLNLLNVLVNNGQGSHSLLQFEIRPPLLDAVGGSLQND